MPETPSPDTRLVALQALMFDLDGTLIDTMDLIRASFRHATEAVLGAPLPDEIVMRNVGVPLAVQMAEFAPGRVEEMLAVYRKHNAEHHDEMVQKYPGVDEGLAALHERGIPMAVVTSKSRPVALRGLKLFGYDKYFEHLVSSDDVTVFKPDPHPLLFCAELMGVEVTKAAYVGDSPHDMTAAIAADALSIAALWGGFPERVLEPCPDYALPTLAALPDMLDGEAANYRLDACDRRAEHGRE